MKRSLKFEDPEYAFKDQGAALSGEHQAQSGSRVGDLSCRHVAWQKHVKRR